MKQTHTSELMPAIPYLWMQEGERMAVANCGCKIGFYGDTPEMALWLCQLHAAAPELLAACEAMMRDAASFEAVGIPLPHALFAALAKARS